MLVAEQSQLEVDDGPITQFQQFFSFEHLLRKVSFVVTQLSNSLVPHGDDLGQFRSCIIFILQLQMELVVLLVQQVQVLFHPVDLLHEILYALLIAIVGREQGLHAVDNRFF